MLSLLRGMNGDHPDLLRLSWRIAWMEKDFPRARRIIDEGMEKHASLGDLWYGLGLLQGREGHPKAAALSLQKAVEKTPELTDAWYELALVRESMGDQAGARAAFVEVWKGDQQDVSPLRTTSGHFEALVNEALDLLPEAIRKAMVNVPVVVSVLPDAWITEEPPWDPRLLGLFSGPDYLQERSDQGMGQTPIIFIFRKNVERICHTDAQIVEEVRVTVIHEVGHWLGLSEEDLETRGLG